MCGITGWIDWERDLTQEGETVRAMTTTMVCRGPDADGVWLSPNAALGHRRLSIIDLTGGVQPMSDGPRSGVVLTYSGEVYNFRELREELSSRGHRFRTSSDTEVVLRSYLEWGADCVERFNGMYAFAVWDEGRQELLLARDRLGVKPLYYAETAHGVLFGSEPKAILANPLFKREIDETGLRELVLTPTVQTPGLAVFKGLREVRPGRIVRVNRGGLHESQYWSLRSQRHEHDLEQTVRHVRELLEDIVERQLVADVPLCSLLSGGVDSSAVTALAAKALKKQTDDKLTSFSLDYVDSDRDFTPDELRPSLDGPFALQVAHHVGTKHTEVVLDSPDLLAEQLATLHARDLPGMGDMDVSLYLLFREVRKHSTVALSGESADEVFGGYPWFHDPAALDLPGFPWTLNRKGGRFEVFDTGLIRQLDLPTYVRDRYVDALNEVPYLDGEEGYDRKLRQAFYLNLTRFLPALLDRKDRMSMAASLEVRVPFCDHRLVEYLWNVPWSMKNVDGQEKGLLRRAVADLLPDEVVNRKKSAFPVSNARPYDLAVRARLGQILGDSGSPLRPLLNPDYVRGLLEAGPAAGTWNDGASTAWLSYLVEIDTWLRSYSVSIV